MAYLISYDIAEKDSWEYEGLYTELKALQAKRILYSEWVVSSRGRTANSIYDALLPLIQKTDRLLVCVIAGDAAWEHLQVSDEQFVNLLRS